MYGSWQLYLDIMLQRPWFGFLLKAFVRSMKSMCDSSLYEWLLLIVVVLKYPLDGQVPHCDFIRFTDRKGQPHFFRKDPSHYQAYLSYEQRKQESQTGSDVARVNKVGIRCRETRTAWWEVGYLNRNKTFTRAENMELLDCFFVVRGVTCCNMWNLWILPNQTSRPTKTSSSDRSVGCIIIACINWWLGTIFSQHTPQHPQHTKPICFCLLFYLSVLLSPLFTLSFFFLSLLTDSVVTITYLMSFVALLNKKQIEKLT